MQLFHGFYISVNPAPLSSKKSCIISVFPVNANLFLILNLFLSRFLEVVSGKERLSEKRKTRVIGFFDHSSHVSVDM